MSRSNWEDRYRAGDMPWEKGAPSPGLVDFLAAHPNLPGNTICVPGCGTGNDVCEWARQGFEVFGFDVAPSAIALAKEKSGCRRHKSSISIVRFFARGGAVSIRLDFRAYAVLCHPSG